MKHFTFAWWLSCQAPSELTDPVPAYRAHLAAVGPGLPADLYLLEDKYSLHDGEVDLIRFDVARQSLVMRVQGDDGSGDARTFLLTFVGVTVFESRTNGRDALPGPGGFGDLGYTEADTRGELAEFRMLFSSGVEMTVVFKDFELQMTDHT